MSGKLKKDSKKRAKREFDDSNTEHLIEEDNFHPTQEADLLVEPGSTTVTTELNMLQRWPNSIEATKAVQDFAFYVQKKRAKLHKKLRGGRNKRFVCSGDDCDWFVTLLRIKTKEWKIGQMNLIHSKDCNGQPKPTAKQVAEMTNCKSMVASKKDVSGRGLQELLLRSKDVKVPIHMTYRAKSMVMKSMLEDSHESFKLIPSFLEQVAQLNPGSIVRMEKDEHGHFIRAFIMTGSLMKILTYSQRILGLDCHPMTHCQYEGVVFTLIARDGNLCDQIVAFAVCPKEDEENYRWFLQLMKESGIPFDMPIFCDWKPSVLNALATEAPQVQPMYCVRHILENMKTQKKIPPLAYHERLIWQAQQAETEPEFNAMMEELKEMNLAAAKYLQKIDVMHWTTFANRSTRLYNWQTTNFAESESERASDARAKAPFYFLYDYLEILMSQVFERRKSATVMTNEKRIITSGANKIYQNELEKSAMYSVRASDESLCFVRKIASRHPTVRRVNLSNRTCTCAFYFHLGIPCRHFIAAMKDFGKSDEEIFESFDPMYLVSSYREAYDGVRIVIPLESDLVKDEEILPSEYIRKRTAGRPKRKRNGIEPKGTTRCTNCSQLGHNRRRCPELENVLEC